MKENICANQYVPTRADKIRWFYYKAKHAIEWQWFKFYWRVLHITRLARLYSTAMCKLNLYKKYPDGRCHWCGNNHEKKWKPE